VNTSRFEPRRFHAIAVLLLALPAGAAEPGDRSGRPAIGTWGVDLDGRDPAVPPDDDFFRHANGTWLRDFEIPENLPAYASFTKLFLESEEHVHAIIQDAAASGAASGAIAQNVGDLFADFVDLDAIEARGLAPLEPWLAEIDALATHEDVARYLGRDNRRGGTSPFAWYVDQDEKNPGRYSFTSSRAGWGSRIATTTSSRSTGGSPTRAKRTARISRRCSRS
jgi:predicted metalloendopeptidase